MVKRLYKDYYSKGFRNMTLKHILEEMVSNRTLSIVVHLSVIDMPSASREFQTAIAMMDLEGVGKVIDIKLTTVNLQAYKTMVGTYRFYINPVNQGNVEWEVSALTKLRLILEKHSAGESNGTNARRTS